MSKKDFAEQLSELAGDMVKESVGKANVELNQFLEEGRKKIASLTDQVPVLEVKVNDSEIKKVEGRASKHLKRLIQNAKIGINTLLVGPAGCGKTTAAKQLAKALGRQFGSLCLTAGASETWLFGRQTPTGFVEGMFSKIYREGGVFLADELDAADPNLLLSINTALANDHMLNPISGELISKHKDFVFIGCANTFGKGATHIYTGRNRLDAATLDRFVSVEMNYDKNLEKMLCPDEVLRETLDDIRKKLAKEKYEEVISTRAYDFAYKQLQIGIPISQIRDSMIASWSVDGKRIAKNIFQSLSVEEKKDAV